MVDAWGKLTPGILNGQLQWLGDYDECLNTRSKHETSDLTFRGRYCRATQTGGMGTFGPGKVFSHAVFAPIYTPHYYSLCGVREFAPLLTGDTLLEFRCELRFG